MTRLGWNVLAAAVAVVSLWLYGAEQRKRGAAEAEGARWKRQLDSLEARVARVDTVYRVRRDTFYLRRERLDTLTVTVDRWKRDTIEVVRYVQQADSTIRACSALVLSCEEREALRIQQLDIWDQRWATREKPPGAFWKWTERGLVFGLGWLSGR